MTLSISSRILLMLSLVLLVVAPAGAQELMKPETNVSERVRLLETELERQNSKLDQLQKTLLEQQQTIQALIEKLSGQTSASPSTAKESETLTTPASAETQTSNIEQRLAKVEGQVLKVGPVRVSGDFRLRYDGIFRSASDPPNPPLDHVQNSRMRYRFRLNLDTEMYPKLKFHGQLSTGPINNPLTLDQDFTSTTARHPLFISEAWIEYQSKKSIRFKPDGSVVIQLPDHSEVRPQEGGALQLQAGRVQEVFADRSRFLFDDDIRFNGFNERYVAFFKGPYISSLDLRAGQYIFSNPNVAVITPNSPLARAGEVVGTAGRSANLFHQGLLINQVFNRRWSDQIGGDLQLYRHPNQIQLASTADGLVLLVQPGLGIALSGPLTGTGNATTTPGGASYTAPGFQVARLMYQLNYAGFKHGEHAFPMTLNVQLARNIATGLNERDAMLAALQVGKITKRADTAFLYVFSIKGANALISQVTDDDLGTGTGVNLRTHHFRFDYGITRNITFQSLFFFQHALRRSGQYPNFFVPIGDFAPTSYRVQQQIEFRF